MLTQYSNIDEILNANTSVSAERIQQSQIQYSSLRGEAIEFYPNIVNNIDSFFFP